MQSFQDIEHFVKTLSAAIKKKIPTKVSQLTNDAGYKTTDTTYKLSKTGSTVTLTGSDGSTTSVTDDNATYSSLKNPYSLDIQNNGTTVASYDGSTAKTANFTNATSSADGLMSAADKAKLDGITSTYATKSELSSHSQNTSNPHKVTASQVGALPLSGGSLTGNLTAPSFQTGTGGANYFQCRKFRGQGDANTYYHAVDFGYAGHNQVDFYEYGGKYVFHKHQENDTVIGEINGNGFVGKVNGHTINADVPAGAKFTDTTYSNATTSVAGLMSPTDKAKLDGIGTGSNVKSVNGKTGAVTLAKSDVGLGSVANLDQSKAIKSITRSGTTFTATALDGTTTTFTQQDTNTTYGVATSSADGLMSKTDKAKLDGISSGADAVTIKTVKVNGTALTPDSNKAVNVTVPTLANNATTTGSGMALDARMGKTLSDQIAAVKTGAIDQIVNLTAAGWTGDTAPYSQTVNVTGMTDELLCELFSACPKSATVAEREAYNEAFALVASGYAETADGSATFLVDEKPAIDIGVRIKSISKANAVSDQTSSDITNAVDAMSNTMWEKIYPVGSIYISANSTSPANLFGGTWEQIKDQFLLAAGDAYAAGDSGGSASHSHTLSANGAACIGNHSNVTAFSTGYKYYWKDYNSGTNMWAWTHNSDKQLTSSTDHYNDGSFVGLTGSTDMTNSMPPYLAVYMWKRTA